MSLRRLLTAGCVFFAAQLLSAQVPSEERMPVHDPDQLRALGFRPNAPNVYVWSKAERGGTRVTDSSAFETPQTWGTAAGYTSIMGHELRSSFDGLVEYLGATYCEAGSGGDPSHPGAGNAQLQLPDGATLSQLQFWAYDIDAQYGLTVNLFESCQAVGANPPVTTLIGSVDTFGAIGTYFGFTPLNNYRVNNRDCGYTVQAVFNAETTCRGSALQLQKVHVGWVRDVSPAPATATFTDVPTSHPFVQYVEALAKAGVTGGCGGGKYCPDAPLTRAQMATFLSRALGLQWP